MDEIVRETGAPKGGASPPRRRKGLFWPWLAGGLLAATVVKYAVVLALIANDPSISIEEDYYARAVAWDGERAAQAASDSLGWSAAIEIGPAPGLPGRAEARIALRDAFGDPVGGAVVTARIFHQARAAEATVSTVEASADGSCIVSVPGPRPGAWRVEIEAHRGDERFIEERTVLFGVRIRGGGSAP